MTKIVISDGKESVQIEKGIGPLTNKKIGDVIDGSVFGLSGYELVITGGSDEDGFPMRRDVSGTGRKKIMLTEGTGLDAPGEGVRIKKGIRGNQVSSDIAQLNTKVVKKGKKSVKELLGDEIKKEGEEESKEEEKPEKKEKQKPEKEEKSEKTEKKPEEKGEKGKPSGEKKGDHE